MGGGGRRLFNKTYVSADDIPELTEIHLGSRGSFDVRALGKPLPAAAGPRGGFHRSDPRQPRHSATLTPLPHGGPAGRRVPCSRSLSRRLWWLSWLSTTALAPPMPGLHFRRRGSLGDGGGGCGGAAQSVVSSLLLLLLLFPVTRDAALIRGEDAPSWGRQSVSRSVALGSARLGAAVAAAAAAQSSDGSDAHAHHTTLPLPSTKLCER